MRSLLSLAVVLASSKCATGEVWLLKRYNNFNLLFLYQFYVVLFTLLQKIIHGDNLKFLKFNGNYLITAGGPYIKIWDKDSAVLVNKKFLNKFYV